MFMFNGMHKKSITGQDGSLIAIHVHFNTESIKWSVVVVITMTHCIDQVLSEHCRRLKGKHKHVLDCRLSKFGHT